MTPPSGPSASRAAPLTCSTNARQPLPGDRGLERLAQHAHGHEACRAGRARAGTPRATRPSRRRGPRRPRRRARGRARSARSAGSTTSSKPSTSSARVPSPRQRQPRLLGLEQAAVGGPQAGLHELAHRVERRRAKSRNDTLAERRRSGRGSTRTHASVMTASVPSEPSSMPVGRRAGARARQPPRLPHLAADGQRAHRLDEVVDVRRAGREVAARARGDPAAERRELERLRVEAQRQPVLGELLLEPRAGRAGLDARGARDRVDLEHAVERAQVDRDDARVARARAGRRCRRPRSCRRRPARPRRRARRTSRAPRAARPPRPGRRRRRAGAGTRRASPRTTSR